MVQSISKTPVTFDQAAAVVERALGPENPLRAMAECEEGWFNAVYRLDLADGTSCLLKIAPPPDVRVMRYEHDIITTEVEALRRVAAHTDVPVPAVLAWEPDGGGLASPWFLMARCEGRLLSELRGELDLDQQAAVDAQLAGHLASLHRITAPTFGRPAPGAPRDERWSVAFARLVDDLLADAVDAGVDLPATTDELAALVADHADALDEVTTAHLVHWDLWDTNVFVDPTSLRVTGVIDFERVLWADPLLEAQFVAKRGPEPIVAAYGTPLFDAPGAPARRRLYDLYLYLVMTVECAYRNYPTDDIESFARPCLAATLDEIRTA